MHVANIARQLGRLQFIHMQMWGGAGAKERRGNECEWELHRRKKGRRERKTACSEECRREQRRWRCIVNGGCRNVSIHGDRWQMPQEGEMEGGGGMTATSQRHDDEEEMAGWGRFCRWTDGQECDSSVLMCYSFSHSCTDPGWVYSGSPSCRGSGPSPVPSSSGPSSHSLQAWSHSTLPETQRCPGPLHNPSEGGAEAATSSIQHCSVHAHTHVHTYTEVGSNADAPSCNSYLFSCIASRFSRKHAHT